jgi:hypothetical protein
MEQLERAAKPHRDEAVHLAFSIERIGKRQWGRLLSCPKCKLRNEPRMGGEAGSEGRRGDGRKRKEGTPQERLALLNIAVT